VRAPPEGCGAGRELPPAALAPEVELAADSGVALIVMPGCLHQVPRGFLFGAAAELVRALVMRHGHQLGPGNAEEHRAIHVS